MSLKTGNWNLYFLRQLALDDGDALLLSIFSELPPAPSAALAGASPAAAMPMADSDMVAPSPSPPTDVLADGLSYEQERM